jgi:glycerol-3-phosphate dehydrogenase
MKREFAALSDRQFDLLVCGGGIYGAWTAYDAALRGLRVAIVEQGDWAGATSSSSSKLIHGGLRYLETYNFKLVRKALAERQMLLEMAPHRVWPLRFGVPVYTGSRIGTLRLKAGLALYDLLASGSNPELAHKRFDLKGFAERFPALEIAGLKGGYTYGDAQTDDARLVLELIAGAMEAGAVCVNYCQLTGYIETNGQATGAEVQDLITHTRAEIRAEQIVNATGQWITATKQGRGWCRLAKGIHLVLPAALADEALLLTAQSDGRVFFMIPWYGLTLLGTTDSDYRGNLDHVRVEPAEAAYLLEEANHYLKSAWTEQDVIGSFAGVRVLQRSSLASPSAVSRDWALQTPGNGVHYSIGGKITSAREDAASIVDTVCAQLGIAIPCPTRNRPFPWTPEQEYAVWSKTASAEAKRLGIDWESAKWLIRRHGKRVTEVFHIIGREPALAERVLPALPFIYADLLYCADDEMAVHLDDLLRRRMPILILAQLSDVELRRLAEVVADAMGWDADVTEREIALCRQH